MMMLRRVAPYLRRHEWLMRQEYAASAGEEDEALFVRSLGRRSQAR